MKSWNFSSRLLSAIILFYCVSGIHLEAQEISKTDLEQRAHSYFDKGQFDRSAVDFETLHAMYPKDTKYAYFLGRSILHSSTNIPRSVELLKFVATRNYGEDAYFYLGIACLYNYEFDDAIIAFNTFRNSATSRQLEKFDVDYWLAVCSNARTSASAARSLKVDNMKVVPRNAILSAFTGKIDGEYIFVPDEFKSEEDINTNYQTLMFIPQNSKTGDYLYFDSRPKNSRQGSEIFRVRRITPENFSLPEALPSSINSIYDEAFPFYDNANNTLYFSSKGHTTSGGFDIFKSDYDSVKATWKTPEKLDFPINTPYDDYLYTLTNNGQSAIFLTNRNSGMREAEAYTIQTPIKAEYLFPAGRDEMLICAALVPSSIEITTDNTARLTGSDSDNYEVNNGNKSIPVTSRNDEYSLLIGAALACQAQADSLYRNANELRSKSENESDYLHKQELLANSTTLEKEATRMQQLADEKYLQAEKLRGTSDNGKNNAETTQLNAESAPQGITVYAYQQGKGVQQAKPENSKEYEQGLNAAKSASTEFTFNFSISNTSPYSSEKPIPVAILPAGLVYRIQLGAYTNQVPENTFGGLTPVSKEKTANETKYYVGYFTSVGAAREALGQVKGYGYPDAFIVSFYDSKRISIQQAREIEFAEK